DVRSIRPLWKRTLHELLEHATSSQSAFIVHLLTTTLILFSAVITVLETVTLFRSTSPGVWFGIETILVPLFTVEYISRAIAWSSSWGTLFSWFTSFFGIINLLAILPYYIEIALLVDTLSANFRFSILRTFRLLRIFRSFRGNTIVLECFYQTITIEVMYLSLKRSKHALLALRFCVVMFLIVFSTLLYFAERGYRDPILQAFMDVDGNPSHFPYHPSSQTTVRYDEITPRFILGRLIIIPLRVFGLLLIALPSFVLQRKFSIVREMMDGNHDKGVVCRFVSFSLMSLNVSVFSCFAAT
ncbi:voltage-gated potassium channel, partial [Rickenella mellea]